MSCSRDTIPFEVWDGLVVCTRRPAPARRLARVGGTSSVSHANLSMDFKIKRGMRGASHQARWNAVWLGALEPAEIGRLFGETIDVEELYSEAVEAWDSCRQKNLVDRTLQFYTELYLQDGILAKLDRASILHGLEARSPFLDLEVANFARRLPHELKIRGGVTSISSRRRSSRFFPSTSSTDRRRDLAPRLEHGFVPSGSGRAEASSLRKSWRRIGRELRTSASTSGANSATASGWRDLGLQM